MQVRPARGRLFTDTDGVSTSSVIVNERFAAKFWPEGEALGNAFDL